MLSTHLARVQLRRLHVLNRYHTEYCKSFRSRQYSEKVASKDEISEEPVKFTTSDAAKWKAAYSRVGRSDEDDMPDIQPFVVSFSVAAFLIYFCILREESDIDQKLSGVYEYEK